MRYPWLYRLLIVCNIARIISILPRDRLSVCLSEVGIPPKMILRYIIFSSTATAKHKITQTAPHDSPENLVS